MNRTHLPALAFLTFALLVLVAVVLLLLLGDQVPAQLWTIEYAALTAAGVAVVPGLAGIAAAIRTPETPAPAPPLPAPAAGPPAIVDTIPVGTDGAPA